MSSTLATPICESGKWATFMLAGEMFALEVQDVQEVLMYQPLTPVPLAPPHIVGLLNLRGQILPAIDLRRRLGFPPRDAAKDGGNLLVLNVEGKPVGVVVDEIGDVVELEGTDWRPTPDTLAAAHRPFVFGICPIEGHVLLGLSVDSVTADESHAAPGRS